MTEHRLAAAFAVMALAAVAVLALPIDAAEGDSVEVTDADGLLSAISGAPDGEVRTIVLGKDIALTAEVSIPAGKEIVLDLNGCTLTNETRSHTIVNHGDLTIRDSGDGGTVDNVTHAKGAVVNHGTFVLESGTLTRSAEAGSSPTDNGGNSWYVVDNQGTMTVKGGSIVSTGKFSSLIRNLGSSADSRAYLTVEGGYLSNGFIALKNDEYGTLAVTGGEVVSDNQAIQNWGQAVISGGELTGTVASWSMPGQTDDITLRIEGDALIEGDVITTAYTDDKNDLDSMVIPVTDISGGKVTGELITQYGEGSYIALPEEGDEEEYAWFQVSGGTFSEGVEDRFLTDGFVMTENPDGTFDVVDEDDLPTVATVGGVGYPSLDQALDAALDGQTVELLTDVDLEDYAFETGNGVVLDLNGHDVHLQGTGLYVKGGHLTVEGGGRVVITGDDQILIRGGTLELGDCVLTSEYYSESDAYGTMGPEFIWLMGSDEDVAEYSNLIVGPDAVFEYDVDADVGAYGVNVNYLKYNDPELNRNTAYGVTVEFEGTFEGNFDVLFYINGNVQATEGNVPRIHIDMDDDKVVDGMFYAAGYGEWTIDGGNFVHSEMLSIKSGRFEINGGTFHSTGEYRDPAEANGNGSEDTGAALSVTTNSAYAGNTEVVVNGGTFISDNGYALYEGIALKEDGTPAADSSDATFRIDGGSFTGGMGAVNITEAERKDVISAGVFSSDVSGYLAEGSVIIGNGDGTYSVMDEDDVPTEPDLPPFIPDDSDDPWLPPVYPEAPSTADDDSVTVVACAAAAIAAAILAAFIIFDTRKK